MDIVVRLLIGIPIFFLLGGLWFFLFQLVVGITNGIAFALSKVTRRLFGINGSWSGGTAFFGIVAKFAKGLTVYLFSISVIWSSFIFPAGELIAVWTASAAFLVLFMVWMPCVFMFGLTMRTD